MNIGDRVGALVAIGPTDERFRGYVVWRFRCDCGNERKAYVSNLRRSAKASCGCFSHENRSIGRRKHGHSLKTSAFHAEFLVWKSMFRRCYEVGRHDYGLYGGRGISVCDRWRAFESFLLDMGKKPTPMHSIDRINNDGNYEPGNCRWATPKEQQNNRRTNKIIEFDGLRLTISQWATRLGLDHSAITWRLKHWPVMEALTRAPAANAKKRRSEVERIGRTGAIRDGCHEWAADDACYFAEMGEADRTAREGRG